MDFERNRKSLNQLKTTNPNSSSRLKRFIAYICYYYLFLIGIFSMRFDFDQRTVTKNRALSIYVMCVNVILLGSLPYGFYESAKYFEHMDGQHLLKFVDLVNTFTQFLVVTVLILTRLKRERHFEKLAYELFAIDEEYFVFLPHYPEVVRHFDRLYFLKFAMTFGQMATNIFITFDLAQEINWYTIALVLYFPNLANIMHGVIFNFYVILWNGCKRFHLINVELLEQLSSQEKLFERTAEVLHGHRSLTMRQLLKLAAQDLHAVSQVHWRLNRLMECINESFHNTIIWVLSAFLLYYIVLGYYVILASQGSVNGQFDQVSNVLGVFAYIMLLTDLYLIYSMCEAIVQANNDTSNILKSFPAKFFSHKSFDNEYEMFCWQTKHKTGVNLGGMFNLNMRSLLALWAFILRHIIILLQSDYEGRLQTKTLKIAHQN